jgi:NADH-quinone oxidoreductase chain I
MGCRGGFTMLRETLKGARSLLTGMKVTFKHAFKKPVTSQYPRERIEMSAAYRNVITLVEKEETGSHDCIDCGACVRVCPSFCIKVEGERPEGMKRKRATLFEVDFALCSECGLCLDVCPTDTLGYSREYDQAGYGRNDFLYDLLIPWRDREESVRDKLRLAEAEKAAAKKATAAKAAAAKKAKQEAEAAASDATDGAPPKKAGDDG